MLTIGKAYFSITFTMVLHRRQFGDPVVIARNEAIFPHVMLSGVEASTFGTRTDPSAMLRMTKSKDCFVVPPRNDVTLPPRNDGGLLPRASSQ